MFRTEVHVAATDLGLSLQDGVVTIGSCFAEVIGNKLRDNKAQVLVNPFGTIFNPLSVSKLLRASVSQQHNFEQNLVQHNGVWYAYDLHSSLSSPNRDELLATVNELMATTQAALQQAKLLIITLGTAMGYRLVSSGEVVANCHKIPASHFNRELLPLQHLQTDLESTIEQLRQYNPALQVLLTVSPVRHIKETIEINSVSKSILRVLCHHLTTSQEQVHYFPAYEIMLDDLRDYRFYGRDMIHPTEVAEDYIWEKFAQAYFSQEFRSFLIEWGRIRKALSHRPFHPASEAHQKFLQHTLHQLQAISNRYKLDTSAEEQLLSQQLIS